MNNYEQAQNLRQLSAISHGFFNRLGGVSPAPFDSLNCSFLVDDHAENVIENRRRALAVLNLSERHLMVPKLTHSNKVIVLLDEDTPESIKGYEADGIISLSSKHVLGVTYADCLPIVVAAVDGSLVAAIHAGWRGILSGIIKETISEIAKITQQKLRAAIGPALSPQGFSFAGEGLKEFIKYWPDFVHEGQESHVDLCGVARAQLVACGVASVEKVGGYTDLSLELFSHRRDKGRSGRHMAVVARV